VISPRTPSAATIGFPVPKHDTQNILGKPRHDREVLRQHFRHASGTNFPQRFRNLSNPMSLECQRSITVIFRRSVLASEIPLLFLHVCQNAALNGPRRRIKPSVTWPNVARVPIQRRVERVFRERRCPLFSPNGLRQTTRFRQTLAARRFVTAKSDNGTAERITKRLQDGTAALTTATKRTNPSRRSRLFGLPSCTYAYVFVDACFHINNKQYLRGK